MTRHLVLMSALSLCLAGCGGGGQTFVPAATAERLDDTPTAAVARTDGVAIVADGTRWEYFPADLEQVLTPMYVELRNETGHEIAVRLRDFRIVTDRGEVYQAMPVHAVPDEGPLRTNADLGGPLEPYQRFTFAPHYGPVYGPGVDYYDGAWSEGWGVGPYHAPGSWRPDLPTEPMIRHALPEGVLEPGGEVAGFLYFEKVDDDARRITLNAQLHTPEPTAARVATIDVPFEAQG